MGIRGSLSGWLALASMVVCAACGGGGGSGGDGGGGGEGGQGGSTASLPVPQVIGEAIELTGPGIQLMGNPVMGAGPAGFAVAWLEKISPYVQGKGVILPPAGDAPSYFPAGDDGTPDAIRASEDGSAFGAAREADGGAFGGNRFVFSVVQATGAAESYMLTDAKYLARSLDVVMAGGKWYLVTCLAGEMDGELRIAKDLTSADSFKIDPLPLFPIAVAPDAKCEQVKLARVGQEVWGVYSAKVGSEGAAFLQRILPEPASEPVMVSDPGASPSDPRLFVYGSDLVVLYREDEAGRYAVRTFDGQGQPKGETAMLAAGEDASGSFDAALVGDHVVIATLRYDGVQVRSFGLDGAAVTAPLLVGPAAGYDSDRPAIGASGDVLGIAHYGDADDDGYPRVVFTRVGGL